MKIIKIFDDDTQSDKITKTINTKGYLILYLDNDKIKTVGDIELKALAPLLMKVAMDRMTNAQT